MKKIIMILIIGLTSIINLLSQTSNNFLDHLSVVVGGGTAAGFGKVYDEPIIREDSGFVTLQKSNYYRTNATFGVLFSPLTYKVWKIGTEDTSYISKGFTLGLFMAPGSFAKLGGAKFMENIDMGLGIGWKAQYFGVMLSINSLSIRQPRQYFVDSYQSNQKKYIVNGQIQSSIDLNNNSIFYTQHLWAIGLHIVIDLRALAAINATSNTKQERLSVK